MCMRRLRKAALIVTVLVMPGWLIGGDSPAPAPSGGDQADRLVQMKLSTLIPKADLDGVTGGEALTWLGDAADVNIHVNWNALAAAGVKKETKINLHLNKVPAGKLLGLILDDLGGTAPLEDVVDQGIVLVSTREDLAGRKVTRVYPAGDLLAAANATKSPPREAGAASRPAKDARPATLAWLVELMRRHLAANRAGAEGPSIELAGTSLVVNASLLDQAATADLLAKLRAAKDAQRINLGLAVVVLNTGNLESLREAVEKAKDVGSALRDGATQNSWSLDRCEVEQLQPGELLLACRSSDPGRKIPDQQDLVVSGPVAVPAGNVGLWPGWWPWASVIYSSSDVPSDADVVYKGDMIFGYAISVLPRARDEKALAMSVAYSSTWLKSQEGLSTEEDKTRDSAKNNFELQLPAGGVKLVQVVPPEARSGGVILVLWRPGGSPGGPSR